MSTSTPLSAWHLPALLIPVHQYKKTSIPNPKQRSHFLPILAYVYRNRFAIGSQIQRRFSHILKSDRTSRRHLAELEALGFLAVIPTRGTSPLWPKTYFCTPLGARRLRHALEARGKGGNVIRVDRSRPEGYSADHVLHELLTTELLLNVWELAQVNSAIELLQTERRSIPSQSAFAIQFRRRETRLEPDAWFVYRHERKGMMCYFCELDAGTMTKEQLKAKFWRYESWAASNHSREFLMSVYRRYGAHEARPNFRILAIVCDRQKNCDKRRLAIFRDAAQPFPTVAKCLRVAAASELSGLGCILDVPMSAEVAEALNPPLPGLHSDSQTPPQNHQPNWFQQSRA